MNSTQDMVGDQREPVVVTWTAQVKQAILGGSGDIASPIQQYKMIIISMKCIIISVCSGLINEDVYTTHR